MVLPIDLLIFFSPSVPRTTGDVVKTASGSGKVCLWECRGVDLLAVLIPLNCHDAFGIRKNLHGGVVESADSGKEVDELDLLIEGHANPTFSFTSRIVSVTMGKRRAAPSPRMLSTS